MSYLIDIINTDNESNLINDMLSQNNNKMNTATQLIEANKAIQIQELEIAQLKEKLIASENLRKESETNFINATDSIIDLSRVLETYEKLVSEQKELIKIYQTKAEEYKNLFNSTQHGN